MKKLISGVVLALTFITINAQSIKTSNTIEIKPNDSEQTIIAKAANIVPTPNQLRALRNEFIAFIHFGPNSFTDKEWGDGFEEPSMFALRELDTDQWCEAMRAAGMKMVIFTAKHHDGFVLWQSRYTRHGIMSSGFRDGTGDVLKDLAASCKKYGLKLGVYLSPADLFQIESKDGLYGNLSSKTMRTIPRAIEGREFKDKRTFKFEVDDYNEYFLNQLFELLTEYGPIDEVWFDGAHPKTKGGQTYNYAAWKQLIHTLAPKAVIFGREDIRWCGNESGGTRQTEWNVIPYSENPNAAVNFPDMTDDNLGDLSKLREAKYLHYQQAETNTSIREGWFFRDDVHQRTRSADDVFDIYERSVGGNSTFLLNIPPNRQGRFSKADVDALREVGARIKETYGIDLLNKASRKSVEKSPSEVVVELKKAVTINRVAVGEDIELSGERVARCAVDVWVDGAWKQVAQATNVGYKRIFRFADVTTDKVRLRILEARLTPEIAKITAHYYKSRPPMLSVVRNERGLVSIEPAADGFGWKSHGENAAENLNADLKIYYTVDGSVPTSQTGKLFLGAFEMASGTVKAVAVSGSEMGAVCSQIVGYNKSSWSVDNDSSSIVVDLGKILPLKGFSYTPTDGKSTQMRVGGTIQTSNDGIKWSEGEKFEFANLTNDPSARYHFLKTAVNANFVRITPKESSLDIKNIEIY